MENIERHLDNVFTGSAARLSIMTKGKTSEYQLDAMGYTVKTADNGKTGTCKILGVYYSRELDCNMYQLQDIGTGEVLNVCEFEVWLKDI